MGNGTLRYKDYKAYDPEYRNKKDMIGPQTAKKVWTHLQTLLKVRGLTLKELAVIVHSKERTLSAISEGTLSNELMRRIQKWVVNNTK